MNLKLVVKDNRVTSMRLFQFFIHPENRFQKQPPEMSCKKGVLKNFTKFTGKQLCQRLFFFFFFFFCASVSFFVSASNFVKKETLAQVFFCEFCEIFQNIVFDRTPPVAASESSCSSVTTVRSLKQSSQTTLKNIHLDCRKTCGVGFISDLRVKGAL